MQVGSRGPQLLLSVKPAPVQPEALGSQWSHRKLCPGDNVTVVDTADFTVQAVHFAFAALLLLAYHIDCLQCFVSDEEAWRRLVTESGAASARFPPGVQHTEGNTSPMMSFGVSIVSPFCVCSLW